MRSHAGQVLSVAEDAGEVDASAPASLVLVPSASRRTTEDSEGRRGGGTLCFLLCMSAVQGRQLFLVVHAHGDCLLLPCRHACALCHSFAWSLRMVRQRCVWAMCAQVPDAEGLGAALLHEARALISPARAPHLPGPVPGLPAGKGAPCPCTPASQSCLLPLHAMLPHLWTGQGPRPGMLLWQFLTPADLWHFCRRSVRRQLLQPGRELGMPHSLHQSLCHPDLVGGRPAALHLLAAMAHSLA